jgi:hypothetical protein
MSVAKPDKGISAKARIVEISWFCVFIYLTVFNIVIAKFEGANLPFQKIFSRTRGTQFCNVYL